MSRQHRPVNKTRRKIIVAGPALGVLTACGGGVVKTIGMGGAPAGTVAQTPAITPPGGTYTSAQAVSLSTQTSGATIYYSTDGTIPTTSSAVYASPISVSASKTVQAISAL